VLVHILGAQSGKVNFRRRDFLLALVSPYQYDEPP